MKAPTPSSIPCGPTGPTLQALEEPLQLTRAVMQMHSPNREERKAQVSVIKSGIMEWHKTAKEDFLAKRVQILRAGDMAVFKRMMQA